MRFAVLLIVACSGTPEPFIANETNFAGFRHWSSFTPDLGFPGNEHLSGPRTVYIAKQKPKDAVKFPVGTIIVKESGDGDLGTRKVFAMVKRGAGFNGDGGALGWEWFELTNLDAEHVSIVWRGVGPATGDAYGPGTGGCNDCHAASAYTDFVFSAPALSAK
jgi:hypothetical protein